MKRALAWLSPLLVVPSLALAVSTQSFVIDSADAFEKGKLEGAAVHGDGKLTRAVATTRIPLEGAALAYASAVGPDGAIYVGTGNRGTLYRVAARERDAQGAAPKPFARTDSALVSALLWVGKTLYAGTLEQGKLLAIDEKGAVKQFATLPGGAHIWALAHDAKQGTLYAATGPEGKLFAIDKSGAVKVLHDDVAEHLLCLALDAEGRLYAGTSNGARLLRIAGGKAGVLYDAPGDELGSLAIGPGFIAIASNEFPETASSDGTKEPGGRSRRKPGKGKLLAVSYDGSVEELYHSDSAHISALEIDGRAVHVGLGQEGRIVRVQAGQPPATWADADERQIVAIHLTAKTPHFVSSDGVAVYRVREPNAAGQWTSAVLDAKVPARFGELHVRAKGKLRIATRSGNTETPDASWSEWSSELETAGPIRSAPARFLQLRALLHEDAELYALEAYYLPQNLPAYVRNVRATPERVADKSNPPGGSGIKTGITLNWDFDNPDGDRLRYRLFYRREGQSSFLPILTEQEQLEKNEYRWETLPVPDGYYRVRVEASDELTTPEPQVRRSDALSAPILVDNRAPQVEELRVEGGLLKGKVSDALGPIAQLEVAFDGAPFRPMHPKDGLLDTAQESFELPLPGKLGAGAHIGSVRATDAARNSSTSSLEFTQAR
jgi:outer membrane protein assembly factor BamB